MGFNLQQYNLVNSSWDYSNADGLDPYSYANADNWSNGSGRLKAALGIGDGKIFGVVINPTKNAEYEANKYIVSGQAAADQKAASEAQKVAEEKAVAEQKSKQEAATIQDKSKIDSSKTETTSKKSNTLLYVGIGGAVLVLGIVGYFVFRKK
jgi:hypothetical protein